MRRRDNDSDFMGVRELFGESTSYGDVRRHMWMAYADGRSGPLPSWEKIQLAMTAFDITALAPETDSDCYWQHNAEWQTARRAAAGDYMLD